MSRPKRQDKGNEKGKAKVQKIDADENIEKNEIENESSFDNDSDRALDDSDNDHDRLSPQEQRGRNVFEMTF